jgi:tRNA 2-thiocytidine biosynthesis protein TtcA
VSDTARLEKSLLRQVGRAIHDWQLIEDGDRVLVAVSGGKDSYTMLHLLRQLQRRAPVHFELLAVNLDQGQPDYPGHRLARWLEENGYQYRMLKENTHQVVLDKLEPGQTMCSLCSRLRRGILYTAANDLGCTKIALGHHRDDLIHTLLLNQLFAGTTATMPPKVRSKDGHNTVIRPLVYSAEADIERFAAAMAFPIIPCNLCGSQPNLKRQRVKRLVDELAQEIPEVRSSLLSAMGNLHPSHLLDRRLWTLPEAPGLRALDGQAPVSTSSTFSDVSAPPEEDHAA